MEVIVRPALPLDTPALLAIERASFPDPWSKRHLEENDGLVAVVGETVVGFLIWYEVFPGDDKALPEFEILNVATHPDYRRQGIACKLIEEFTASPGAYFLEVRESNHAAFSLYQHLGFVEVGRRPKYYRRPAETAIVMKMKRC